MKKILSFKSKFGWITLTEYKKEIQSIYFAKKKNLGNSILLNNLKKQIENYFSKKNKKIKLKVKVEGNNLQKKVFNEIKKIKFGKTKSYGKIAKKLNLSPRYVGRICSLNKHLLLIPCHRVIRTDGTLGGFSAPKGIRLKKNLLNFEKE